jgi:hypothetical protein
MSLAAVAQALAAGFGYLSDPRGGTFSLFFAIPWLASAAFFWGASRSRASDGARP